MDQLHLGKMNLGERNDNQVEILKILEFTKTFKN